MNPVKIGVIGCGHWGPNHVRVFSQIRESEVVACADADQKRLHAIQEQYPHVQPFTDYRKLLADAAVDAVVIATPTRLHYGMVQDALTAGKHVLCEKPLCVQSAEARELTELATRQSLILMVGHVFLFNTGIIKLKELLKFREAGRVHYLRALRTNLGPIREDVNCVFDLATHDISIFNFLLEAEPESVSAVGGTFLQDNIEDVAFVSLRYPDNILAHIQVSWIDPKKLREIVVVGDKKMIIWDDLSVAGPITIYDKGVAREPYYDDFGQFHLLSREGDITIPKVKAEEPLKSQNRFFLQAIKEGRLRMSNGAFATNISKVLEAINQSLKQGGNSVTISGRQ